MPKRSTSPPGKGPAAAEKVRDEARRNLKQKFAELFPPGTVDAAVNETGLNRSTIYKWIAGKQQPNVIDLAVLANHLHVRVSDLLSDEPPPRRLTPYETNARYRDLVDAINVLSATDREEVIRHAIWEAERIFALSTPDEVTVDDSDRVADLAAQVHSLPEKELQRFLRTITTTSFAPATPTARWLTGTTADEPRKKPSSRRPR